jgi:hypothetical protein
MRSLTNLHVEWCSVSNTRLIYLYFPSKYTAVFLSWLDVHICCICIALLICISASPWLSKWQTLAEVRIMCYKVWGTIFPARWTSDDFLKSNTEAFIQIPPNYVNTLNPNTPPPQCNCSSVCVCVFESGDLRSMWSHLIIVSSHSAVY